MADVKLMPPDVRDDLSLSAAREVKAIARTLLDRRETDGSFDELMRGCLLRVETLADVLVSLNDGRGGRDWGEVNEVIFGRKGRHSA